jgi:hypothetical protein
VAAAVDRTTIGPGENHAARFAQVFLNDHEGVGIVDAGCAASGLRIRFGSVLL